jgi:hypothetical protein
MTSLSPDLMRPETGNPYPKYRGIIFIMGFHVEQDSHQVRYVGKYIANSSVLSVHFVYVGTANSSQNMSGRARFTLPQDVKRELVEVCMFLCNLSMKKTQKGLWQSE